MGVFECDIVHRRPVTGLYMLYKIRCNPMDSLYCALSVTYCMSQCLLHLVLWPYIGNHLPLLDAEPLSTAGLSFPSQFLIGTILLTLYLVVYHRPVLRVGPLFVNWPKQLAAVSFSVSSLSRLLSMGR